MGNLTITEVGQQLPAVSKTISQAKIDQFELVGIREGHFDKSIHTSAAAASQAGIGAPIASGRMQLAFVTEVMHNFFNEEWAKSGRISLSFLKPVRDGDTIIAKATFKERVKEDGGERLVFDVWCEGPTGEKHSAGTASARAAR
jgi:acyl dehydratase